ncbi:MAG TPA: Lrp/AsnC family transcriptional regulator [Gemmatimonadales bacterium]|nr:Lrp/AsnC family transcriptional regulator [Gemmatimonadales bacterium]
MKQTLPDTSANRHHRLDSTERRMIELLQEDGRLSVAELARELNVTEVTARRKLKRLLNDGVIRVVATVDPFDVGYETPVIIGLKVERGKLDAVASAISSYPQVRYVGASTGRVDLIVEIVTRTNQDLADFLMNELQAIDGITDSETNLIVRIYKQTWHWGILDETRP